MNQNLTIMIAVETLLHIFLCILLITISVVCICLLCLFIDNLFFKDRRERKQKELDREHWFPRHLPIEHGIVVPRNTSEQSSLHDLP